MHHLYVLLADLANPLPRVTTANKLQVILNIVLAIMGAAAVLVIVLAGFRYIVSQGSPDQVQQAKSAIIYSLVGLVVIMSAFAIVNFVLEGVS